MEIFGIGASEIIFILIIAIIVLGPKDMLEAGKTVGKWMRSILMSDAWMATQQVSREIRNQWTHIIREANEDLNKIGKEVNVGENLKDPNFTPQVRTRSRSIPVEGKPPAASASADALKKPQDTNETPSSGTTESDLETHD